MFITDITLKNFRNISATNASLSPDINLFLGDNAQGKTNFLESIYFCAMGKSHRTVKDSCLIMHDQDYSYIKTNYEKKDGHHDIQIYIQDKIKRIKCDNQPILKRSQLIGQLCMVMFSPEDLRFIKNGPSERRKFLDIAMAQVYPNYFYHLNLYNKVLKIRNADLKNLANGKKSTLDIWDEKLANSGIVLIKHRMEFVDMLNQVSVPIHKNIIKNENIFVEYPTKDISVSQYMDKLESTRSSDIRTFTTSFGPHRDDLNIKINNIDIKNFGSQGQQRTSALTLKLGELAIMESITGEKPILLLDDVMSELDKSRQAHLLDMIKGTQAFITTTHLDALMTKAPHIKTYNVLNGIIK